MTSPFLIFGLSDWQKLKIPVTLNIGKAKGKNINEVELTESELSL